MIPQAFTRRTFGSAWPVLFALVFGWALAIRPMLVEWQVNPQYQYGLLVPLLCLVLLRGRMADRPVAGIPTGTGRRVAVLAAVVSVLALALVQPVYEANPGWRLIGGVTGPAIVALTLVGIYWVGGRAWLQHFSFPVAFFLIAVPWPSPLEDPLMSRLMHMNAGAAVELLRWLGYEAVQSGNLVKLANGTLGVEEACSGVRSLRSGLMAALFMGEYFRLGLAARTGLLTLAIGTALGGNLVRTFLLATVASASGVENVHTWHDPAGMTILIATILVLWMTASWLSRPPQTTARSAGMEGPPSLATPRAFASLSTLNAQPSTLLPSSPALPRAFALGAAGFWIVALVGTEAWFRAHDRGAAMQPGWSVQIPATMPDAQRVEITDGISQMLRYDEGTSGRWIDAAGLRWQFFYFRWRPSFLQSEATSGHNPESCLGGMGMKLESHLGTHVVESRGVRLPFRVYRFRDGALVLHLFHAVVEDAENGHSALDLLSGASRRDRLEAVLRGKRNRGQRLVEVGVWDAADLAEAQAGLQQFLDQALISEGRHAAHTASNAPPM